MSAFQLDTSGTVYVLVPGCVTERPRVWSDLSPFEQGYIEAMPWESLLAVAVQRGGWAWLNAKNRETDSADVRYFEASWRSLPGLGSYVKVPGFSDLHPDTLSAIRKDCGRLCGEHDSLVEDREAGAHAWRVRQVGRWPNFPPQVPFLDDEGRVCLRGAGA